MKPLAAEQIVDKVAAATGYGLALLIGLQLAWWGWVFLTPAPLAIAPKPNSSAGFDEAKLARRLFGDSDAATPPEAAAASNIRLKGVFADATGKLSAAVVNLGGKDKSVLLNDDLGDGSKLAEVFPDRITVSRKGIRETVMLDGFRAISPGSSPAVAQASNGFRLNVSQAGPNRYNLSRQELNNVIQDPRQLEFLGRISPAAGGGIRVDDAPGNALAGKLGLQAGDVITAVNGQPVNSTGDLARLYQQFGMLSQVRLELRRGGTPQIINYGIQN